MRFIAVDFETEWRASTAKKLGVEVGTQGSYHYHRQNPPYLVAAFWSDSDGWAGTPELFPWADWAGDEVCWIAHNAGFEQGLFAAHHERWGVPRPKHWFCTADMARFLHVAGSLTLAVQELLKPHDIAAAGLDPELLAHFLDGWSKVTRKDVSGKKWADMDDAKREKMRLYCASDAWLSWALWRCHGHRVTPKHLAVSAHTRTMQLRGLPIDLRKLNTAEILIQEEVEQTTERIPWHDDHDAKGKRKALLSAPHAAAWCLANGFDPPASSNVKSEEWLRYQERFPAAARPYLAQQDLRSLSKLRAAAARMQLAVVPSETDPGHGFLPYDLYCFGAHTGRPSGSGFNVLNMPKKGKVAMREIVTPPPGYVLIDADWAQIEARIALHVVGDTAQIDLLRQGMSPYEAHARMTMGYDDPRPLKSTDPEKYQFAKVRVLSAGYRIGANKFRSHALTSYGVAMTDKEARDQLTSFKLHNPLIIAFWRTWDREIAKHHRKDMFIELPDGFTLAYYDIRRVKTALGEKIRCYNIRGRNKPAYIHGGTILENICQALTASLLGDRLPDLEAVAPVILHVYDQVVLLAREEEAPALVERVREILQRPPSWAPTLPIEADIKITNEFKK